MGFDNGKILRVALEAVENATGDRQVNTFHYDLVDQAGVAPNDPQTLADLFRDDVVPHFAAMYDNTWTISPVVVSMELDPLNPDAPRQQWVSGANTGGTHLATGDKLPKACCCVFKVETDHIGRRATGRVFWGGSLTEGDQANGVYTGGVQTRCQQVMGAIPMRPDLSSAIGEPPHAFWCVYSRTARAQSSGTYSFGVKGWAIRDKVHWLRSRE